MEYAPQIIPVAISLRNGAAVRSEHALHVDALHTWLHAARKTCAPCIIGQLDANNCAASGDGACSFTLLAPPQTRWMLVAVYGLGLGSITLTVSTDAWTVKHEIGVSDPGATGTVVDGTWSVLGPPFDSPGSDDLDRAPDITQSGVSTEIDVTVEVTDEAGQRCRIYDLRIGWDVPDSLVPLV